MLYETVWLECCKCAQSVRKIVEEIDAVCLAGWLAHKGEFSIVRLSLIMLEIFIEMRRKMNKSVKGSGRKGRRVHLINFRRNRSRIGLNHPYMPYMVNIYCTPTKSYRSLLSVTFQQYAFPRKFNWNKISKQANKQRKYDKINLDSGEKVKPRPSFG